MAGNNGNASDRLARLLNNLAARARAVLTWEQVWPALVPALVIIGIFVTVSWLGLWIHVPGWARTAGVALFGLALLASLYPLLGVRLPSRKASLARIDRDTRLPHRPASTLDDQLANASGDPATRALWAAHVRRARNTADALRVGAPSPKVPEKDRYAFRAAAVLALVASAFIAGPEKYSRLLAAFDWRTTGSITQGFRLDAWIDPPGYTGRPPVLLKVRTDGGGDTVDKQSASAPVGSTIIIRSSDGAGVTAEVKGGLEAPKPKKGEKKAGSQKGTVANRTPTGKPAGNLEQRWTLKGDGTLVLRRLGRVFASFEIKSIPDKPPQIALKGDPRSNARGSLTLRYTTSDDYGILSAEAQFSDPMIDGKPVKGRTLVGPPKMPLGLPATAGGIGETETTKDFSDHPWAGARVKMVLKARDEGGNSGESKPAVVFLPQKTFVKPLARALVEQRRNLVLAPDDTARVKAAFEGLMIAPEEFKTPASIYLGLNTIHSRLTSAKNDDDLRAVADLIWEMALRIEEGDLSEAERALRAAQQALRDALERGASEEEIKELMKQLRAAMDRFLREFAQQQMRNQRQNPQAMDRSNRDRMLTRRDLQSMLDRMEQMARQGRMADARRMLDQLQRMLENLRSARRGQQQNSMGREMNRALNQLDQMMRDQQQLRDRTFRESQRRDGKQGQNGQQLRQRQEALRRQLQELQRRMQQFGMQAPQGFGQAEREMRQAEGQLGKGRQGQGQAVQSQGRALDALRRGAQALAQQMQRQRGIGRNGPGDPMGQPSRDTANPDPLGREQRNRGDNSRALFDPPGAPAAQRAQRILEELRRRLSDPSRPSLELEYLERLLRKY